MYCKTLAPLWTTWVTQNRTILESAERPKIAHLSGTRRSATEDTEAQDQVTHIPHNLAHYWTPNAMVGATAGNSFSSELHFEFLNFAETNKKDAF